MTKVICICFSLLGFFRSLHESKVTPHPPGCTRVVYPTLSCLQIAPPPLLPLFSPFLLSTFLPTSFPSSLPSLPLSSSLSFLLCLSSSPPSQLLPLSASSLSLCHMKAWSKGDNPPHWEQAASPFIFHFQPSQNKSHPEIIDVCGLNHPD